MKRFLGSFLLLATISLIVFLFLFSSNEVWESEINTSKEKKGEELFSSEIIYLINSERLSQNLVALEENFLLRKAAEIKLEDMVANQYFAHQSPDGKYVEDLATQVGYDFIATGENLAMGNFVDNEDLVKGWMESPEHRENVMRPGYRETGVAVEKVVYEKEKVWVAVQVFGLPSWVCPDPDRTLLSNVNLKQEEADILARKIESLKKEVESSSPRDPKKVSEYNSLVSQYNQLMEEMKNLTSEYNKQVDFYNNCIDSYGF